MKIYLIISGVVILFFIGVVGYYGAKGQLPKYEITMTNDMTGNGNDNFYYSDSIIVQEKGYIQFVDKLTGREITLSGRYMITPSFYPLLQK